ncbi:MAG: AraC family transcriptional regulator [Sphingobacterium sp.]|jgi:AraC-like DNA-binding protein|nr:AraC family transcriptional regulator [Sphingobacterium sp.]
MNEIQLIDQSELSQKGEEYNYHPLSTTCILLYKGAATINCNGSPVELKAGCIFFIGYNKYYSFMEISTDAVFKILNYDRNFSNRIRLSISRYDAYRLINASSSAPFTPATDDFETIWTLLSTLHRNRKRPVDLKKDFLQKADINIFMAIIYLLANVIYTAGQSSNQIRNKRKEEITVHFLQLIADHYKTQRDLAFYADRLHISIKYLSISVKEITKESPSEIISNWLITEARAQLIISTKTINQISQEFNFSDQYAFSKFFKKHVGITPKLFREQQTTLVTN